MSWSCYTKGTKEEVKKFVEESLDNSAKIYDGYGTPTGSQEAQDCRDAKRAILSAVEGMRLDPDSWAKDGYFADVVAYGSRSDESVTLHVEVMKRMKEA